MTQKFLRSDIPIFGMACVCLSACTTDSRSRRDADVDANDKTISTQVKSAFAVDSRVGLSGLEVEAYNGVVQLRGLVDSQAEADRAIELARGVSGVRDVKNDMRIRSSVLSAQ